MRKMSVLPQGRVALYFNDIQGVEVGHKQVWLPVGCVKNGDVNTLDHNHSQTY